ALGLPEQKPAPYWWLAAGLFAGLAMLSKYNAALVLAGAALGVLLDPAGRRELCKPWPWLGVLLALALFSPVVVWNVQHHWASFSYQGGRATGLRLRPFMPLSVWGGEALYVLPWLWAPMVWLLVCGFAAGSAKRVSWLLAWAAVIPVLLFAIVGLWSRTHILFHWAAPGYLMLFPLLGDWAARRSPRLIGIVAGVSGGLLASAALLIVALVQFGLPPVLAMRFQPGKSPMLQAVDWVSIGPAMPPGIDAVAARRWFDAGKIGYALRRDGIGMPVTVFGREPHQFAFTTPPESLLGKTVLIIAMPGSTTETWNRFAPDFASIKPGPVLPVLDHGQILLLIPTFIGTDLRRVP
ncbi:MAG: glycosyltransferase family 39 protein, partial [Rhodospirillales bacterium]|nr:glycosyltransferase family 39 protein [Rhodospirillales bacterium]